MEHFEDTDAWDVKQALLPHCPMQKRHPVRDAVPNQ